MIGLMAYLSTQSALPRDRVRVIVVAWVVVVLIFTVAGHLALFQRDFDYEHAWIDGIYATMARAFNTHGIIALRGVPIQNNPPLGTAPDAYIHWPPLFPIVLSWWFRAFGESEGSAHALMLVNLLAMVFFLRMLVRELFDETAGHFALIFALTMPVTIHYGHQVISQSFALTLLVASIWCFVRYSTTSRPVFLAAMVFTTALGVASSWEAGIAPFGLAAAAFVCDRRFLPACLLAVAASVGTFGMIMAVYLLSYPVLAADLWQTILFRAGVAQYRAPTLVHTFVNRANYSEPTSGLRRLWQMTTPTALLGDLGRIALFSIPVAVLGRWRWRRDFAPVWIACAGLLAPWLLWSLLMPNHIFHPQMALFAVPVTSLILGVGASMFSRMSGSLVRAVVLTAVPLVALLPFVTTVHQRWIYDGRNGEIQFAREIEANVPQTAVVMTPNRSGVPLYYSRRHLIRGVTDDAVMQEVVARLPAAFPGAPLYLAITPSELPSFPETMKRLQPLRSSPDLVLVRVR